MRTLLTGAFLALVLVPVAQADLERDRRVCVRPSSPQAGIDACTKLLKSGQFLQITKAVIYYNRGNAYVDLKRYRKAIADYAEAVRIRPRYAKAYLNRGLAYQRLGERRQAIFDYRAAYKLKPWDRKYVAKLREMGVKP